MNLIDTQYTATPFYGIRCMTAWLATQGTEMREQIGQMSLQTGILLAENTKMNTRITEMRKQTG